MIEDLTPRHGVAVGLLALIPVFVYTVFRPDVYGYVSAISVVVITVALLVAFSPIGRSDVSTANGTGG